jgi:hypothetical protein
MRPLFSVLAVAAGFALPAIGAAAPPTNAEVGDAASFGSRVTWIGLLTTGYVMLERDCSALAGSLGPDDRCVTIDPPPALTTASFADLGRITLPKDSTDSLICHWVTPTGYFEFANSTGAPATASFRSVATFRFESSVLNDPNLINPVTGLPFNGAIERTVTTYNMSRTLATGATQLEQIRGSRVCIGGLLSQQALVDEFGLTEGLAKKVLKEPITIRGGVIVTARHVVRAEMTYGTRFTGDKK